MLRATFSLYLTILSLSGFSQEYKQLILRDFVDENIGRIGITKLETSNNLRTYRIWITYQQIIEISELPNSTYDGYIINYINQTIGRGKRERTELVVQKAPIPQARIEDLMNDLQAENIETLPDDAEIEDYPDGLDGTSYIFEIKTSNGHRFYSFWEPMNDSYTNEQIPEVANVRNIIRRLNTELNLWEYFKKFRDRLPSGNYSYGGIQMIKL